MQVQIGIPTVNDPVGPDSWLLYCDSGDVGYVLSQYIIGLRLMTGMVEMEVILVHC